MHSSSFSHFILKISFEYANRLEIASEMLTAVEKVTIDLSPSIGVIGICISMLLRYRTNRI